MMELFTNQLDELSTNYQRAYSAISSELLNLKPSPEAWSLGQILEHIIIINKSFFPIIEAAQTNTLKLPWISRLPFIHKRFGQMILKSVHPDTHKKSKTFTIWQPTSSEVSSKIFDQFIEQQESLKNAFQSCTELINSNQLIHSPANRFIVYSLETAFKMILLHEQRHLNQAIRTKGLLLEKGDSQLNGDPAL